MIKVSLILFIVLVGLGVLFMVVFPTSESINPQESTSEQRVVTEEDPPHSIATTSPIATTNYSSPSWSMKLVNENITNSELDHIKNLGISVLSGEWGIDDATPLEVLSLLDRVAERDMHLIINFSDGSAWGFKEDGSDREGMVPEWQKEKVQNYMKALGGHRAIYGYDISNEAGENLPSGDVVRITFDQMKTAAESVREVDGTRPILIRMHYWDEFDGDFGSKNPFGPGVVDIVMLNLYSNFTVDGATALLPNMIENSGQSLVDKIKAVDPQVRVWVALGAFREEPHFIAPTKDSIQHDIESALQLGGIENIGFFGWGPERYTDEGEGWYLPRDGTDLLDVIKESIDQGRIHINPDLLQLP